MLALVAPVVLLFHGNGSSYDDMLGLTGVKAPYKVWLDIALQENLIIVAPDGTPGSSNSKRNLPCLLAERQAGFQSVAYLF